MPYTERIAIEDQLRTNRNLIADLRRENMDFIKRLRDLDDRDFSKTDGSNEMAENLSKAIDKLTDLVPDVPADVVIKKMQEKFESGKAKEALDPPEEKELTKEEKLKDNIKKDRVHKHLNTRIRGRMSPELSASIIKDILSESDRSMQIKEIEKEFEKRTGKTFAAFGKKVKDAMEAFPEIKSTGTRGWYEFKKRIPNNTEENVNQNLEAVN